MVSATALSGSCGHARYEGPVSDHFDGETFVNADGQAIDKGLGALLKRQLLGESTDWPDSLPVDQVKPQNTRVDGPALTLTFVNHATWLIQTAGLNLLTDPIWSDRASPVSFAGPHRIRKPGIAFEDLPPIDIVIISHNHYDHMDLDTLERLRARDNPMFLMGLGNGSYLDAPESYRIQELDWGQSTEIGAMRVTFEPAQHWCGRGLFDRNETLWGSYVIHTEDLTVYFAGDTGYGGHFSAIARKHPKIDVALLPIGAYEPRWFMAASHMAPKESVRAFVDSGATRALGMHFGTFQLTDEGVAQPLFDLSKALSQYGLSSAVFRAPAFGEAFSF
jgi:L-ascorbate metabolism protein UlaG (beta-lactamase superfamily)